MSCKLKNAPCELIFGLNDNCIILYMFIALNNAKTKRFYEYFTNSSK